MFLKISSSDNFICFSIYASKHGLIRFPTSQTNATGSSSRLSFHQTHTHTHTDTHTHTHTHACMQPWLKAFKVSLRQANRHQTFSKGRPVSKYTELLTPWGKFRTRPQSLWGTLTTFNVALSLMHSLLSYMMTSAGQP